MNSTLPYTYRSSTGNFFARFVVPKDLRQTLNIPEREIRFSLQTKDRNTANHKIFEYASIFQKNIDELRTHRYTVHSSSLIGRIKQCVIHKEIYNSNVSRSDIMQRQEREVSLPRNRSNDLSDLTKYFSPSQINSSDSIPKSFFGSTSSLYSNHSRSTRPLMRGINYAHQPMLNPYQWDPLNKVTVEFGVEKITFDSGNHNLDKEDANEWLEKRRSTGGGGGGGTTITNAKTIAEVIDLFVKSKIKSGDWSDENTRNHEQSRIDFMFTMIDTSKPFSSLTRADARQMRDKVSEIPDRRFKDGNKVIVAQTAKKYFVLFQAICRFAFAEEHHHINIADGVEFKVASKTHTKRQGFTQDDLTKLLSGYHYTQTPLNRVRDLYAYHFWVILIALHSGARLNEICQLRICDIIKAQGYWCFNFQEQGEGQSVKTENSIRKVPIHKALLNLGFLEFVQSRKNESPSSDLLFIGLNFDKKNKFGKKVSDWFNGNDKMSSYLSQCNLTDPDDKVFHSTRHTVIQCLVDQDVEEVRIASVVGHEHGSTTSRYGRGRGIKQLASTVNMIDHDIDLSHLNFDAFMEYARWRGRPNVGSPIDIKANWERKKKALAARKKKEADKQSIVSD